MQVCGYKVAILILLCSLKHFSVFMEILKKPFCENMGYLLFLSFFFFSFFLTFSFITFFYDSLMSLFTTTHLRERSYIFGAFILIEPNQDIFVHSQCRSSANIWGRVRDLGFKSMINFLTWVNKAWQSSMQ